MRVNPASDRARLSFNSHNLGPAKSQYNCILYNFLSSRKIRQRGHKAPLFGETLPKTLFDDKAMGIGITVINEDGVIAVLARPAFDTRYHCVIVTDLGFLDHGDAEL